MRGFHRHPDGTGHQHDLDVDHEDYEYEDHVGLEDHADADADAHGDMSGFRTGPNRVRVLEGILSENNRSAVANRQRSTVAGSSP